MTYIYLWSKLYNCKINLLKIKNYVYWIMLSAIMLINYYNVNRSIKILVISLIFILFNYAFFNKNLKETILSVTYTQVIIVLTELIFTICMYFIFKDNLNYAIQKYFGTLIVNIVIGILAIFIINIKFIKIVYNNLLRLINKINYKMLVLLMLMIIVSINVLLPMAYYKLSTVNLIIINSLISFVYMFIIYKIFDEKNKSLKISKKYDVTVSSLKSLQQVLDVLKINNHENKNQIKLIRNLIIKGDKKVIDYIDKILNEKIKDDEKLMFETSTISNSGIGSIIYSKMLYMKNYNIKTLLSIDKNLRNYNLIDIDDDTTLDICKILGVLLDNAIEEVIKHKNKNISISLFVNNNLLNISVANNCRSKIDINRINDSGYTTKGKNHGYGLSLVKSVVDNNKLLDLKTEISKNIFKQVLIIKL